MEDTIEHLLENYLNILKLVYSHVQLEKIPVDKFEKLAEFLFESIYCNGEVDVKLWEE